MRGLKKEDGFTLVEVLVVIAIISILFVTLMPQIENAVNRSRETGVKTDFRSFQLGAESYIRETTGKQLTYHSLNKFLDKNIALVDPGADATTTSASSDPWGSTYRAYVDPNRAYIWMKSNGKDEIADTDDDYAIYSYYVQGTVASCTVGFGVSELPSDLLLQQLNTSGNPFQCGDLLM